MSPYFIYTPTCSFFSGCIERDKWHEIGWLGGVVKFAWHDFSLKLGVIKINCSIENSKRYCGVIFFVNFFVL